MAGLSRSMRLALGAALAVVLVFAGTQPAYAVKANPKPVTYYQPDDTPIAVKMVGDERVVFVEDAEGRTLVRDASTGWWLYADPASHRGSALRPSKFVAGRDNVPATWRKHVRPAIDVDKLPGPPFVQQDDGSIGELFRNSRAGGQTKTTRFEASTNASRLTPTTVPVLVILVEFSDWKHTTGANTPAAGEPNFQPMPGQPNNAPTWQTLLGDRNVAGGLNHFYWEATYQRMQWNVTVAQRGKGQAGTGTLVNDGWYTNPNTMKYWGADKTGVGGACNTDGGTAIKGLITWAINQANADVNYAQYDTDGNGQISDAELMIFVIHARAGQENYGEGCGTNPGDTNNEHIWSHKWNVAANIAVDGKTIPLGHIYAIEPEFSPTFNTATSPWTLTDKYFGVGVFAHEALHTLGAPDIYDTGYDATPAGNWDLMDGGSYNGEKSGTHPAHMGGPLKQDLKLNADTDANSYGFILESEITDVAADGARAIDATGNGTSAGNVLHRIAAPNDATEWFLLENRAPVGYYEPFLPEHGVIIWHRDRGVSGAGNNSWPYQANVLRAGWQNDATGLQADANPAAFSLEDGQTTFTATTNPHNKLNDGSASGLKDLRCMSAENSQMSYAYGTVAGSHVAFTGASGSGPDGDDYFDDGETATLTVNVANSACAGGAASVVSVSVSSSDAAVGGASPASVAVLAPGTTSSFTFPVTLACPSCESVTFNYTIYVGGVAVGNGSFTRTANRGYHWFDDADANIKSGWSSASSFVPSACTTATRHGDWAVTPHILDARGNSYRTPLTNGLTYANPDEAWITPNITLPAGKLRELRFSYAAEIPCNLYTRGRVWMSVDNGATWIRNEDFFRDLGNLSWEEVRLDLSHLKNATQVRFMFAMYTYTCQTGCAAARGIYVDNIGVVVDTTAGTADTQAPSTAITAPANGATVSGLTTVSASASDNIGVTRVEFFVDGTLAATDTSSPYSFSWNTTLAANGAHVLTSKAYDAANNAGTSATVTVTVNNAAGDVLPPVITNVTSVVTNAKNGSFEIRWTTNEPSTSVVILNGTTYSDTALVTNHVRSFRGTKGASYTYTVRSVDAAGNAAQSGPHTHQN